MTMTNFEGFGLPATLLQSLKAVGFNTPTPIQAAAIPLALEGKDILGSAQTGTGKTGAFSIPLITKLLNSPRGTALVLTPTRELATQVEDNIKKLLNYSTSIKTALLIGGDSMHKQLDQLKRRPRVIIGTPGRINDHLERGSLLLHDANFLVLDEMDRMLDMGFGVQLERIMKFMPQVRQTLMFSATIPANIVQVSQKYLKNAERISMGSATAPAAKIEQVVVQISEEKKYDELLNQLGQRAGSIIVFVKTKWGADKMASRLRKEKYGAEAIHGDLRQNQRDRVIKSFREKKYRVLVATDIAARGLDIPHIEHVINYNLPQCPEDYIHRIGRTARAGAEGAAVCLVSPGEASQWRAIQKLMNPNEKHHDNNGGHSQGNKGNHGKGGFKGKRDGFKGGFKRDHNKGEGFKDEFKSRRGDEFINKAEHSNEGQNNVSQNEGGQKEHFKGEGYKGNRNFKGGFKGKRDFKGGFKRDHNKGEGFKSDRFKGENQNNEGQNNGEQRNNFKGEGFKGNRNFKGGFKGGYKGNRNRDEGFKGEGFKGEGFKNERKGEGFKGGFFKRNRNKDEGFKGEGYKGDRNKGEGFKGGYKGNNQNNEGQNSRNNGENGNNGERNFKKTKKRWFGSKNKRGFGGGRAA